MFRYLISVAALALVALATPVPSGPLRIQAPKELTQCGIATFTWTQTSAPYYFSILRSDEASGTTGFTKDSDTAVIPKRPTASWIVDYPAGTTVRIIIRDSNGDIAGTVPLVVGEGSDECMEEDEFDYGFVDQSADSKGREF